MNQSSELSFSKFLHNTEVATLYIEMDLLNEATSIWQPPKLA